MRSSMIAVVVGIVVCWSAGPVRAGGIVVDQQPTRLGGLASDTAYYYPFPPIERWQLEADNVLLDQAVVIRQVSWWGFYGVVGQGNEPPDGPETMRVRFYGARPGDGLPDDDNILYEESFLNPSRTATGDAGGQDWGNAAVVQDALECAAAAGVDTEIWGREGEPPCPAPSARGTGRRCGCGPRTVHSDDGWTSVEYHQRETRGKH